MAAEKSSVKPAKKLSKLEALRAENRARNTTVEAAQVRYVRPSSDRRTNVWRWTCGSCESTKTPEVNTMCLDHSEDCENCGAINTFDFRKYGV